MLELKDLPQRYIDLLEDYVDLDDLERYPAEWVHDRFKGAQFWLDHEQTIVLRGSSYFVKNFLYFIGAENTLPELKVGDLWLFIDGDRMTVVDRLIRESQKKRKVA